MEIGVDAADRRPIFYRHRACEYWNGSPATSAKQAPRILQFTTKGDYYFRFDRKIAARLKCGMFDEQAIEKLPEVPVQAGSALDTRGNVLTKLAGGLAPLAPADRLELLRREVEGRIVFTHGFGIEGQLLFHWICERGLDIDVVTLDTGRLFPETYALWAETERRYGRRIRAIHPHHTALEKLVAKQGVDGFYESKEARLACCDVRKVRPLERALSGAAIWLTAVRGDQTETRRDAGVIAFDPDRGLIKFNPLFDWTRASVLAAVKAHDVPINTLHAQGFASIGCAPCTRAIKPGEPERNGRWWWEKDGHRECGLHLPRPAV